MTLGDPLFELGKNLVNILFRREHEYEFELCDFDIDGIIVFAEEHANVVA